MNQQKAIKLGRGFTDVQFGTTKDYVEKVYGEPDVIDTFENESPDLGESHVWHYDNASLSFTFDEIDEFRLSMISVNSDNYILRDVIRVGMNKQQVLDALDEINLSVYGEEDHSNLDNPNHTLIAVDEKSLYLWFDNDELTEIQWFPYYDEDEEIIWPV